MVVEREEAVANAPVALKHSYRQQLAYIKAVWSNSEVFGLERWLMLVFLATRLVLPSMIVQELAARFAYPRNKVVVDIYVVLKPVALLLILKAGLAPKAWALGVACVLVADLYIYLLSIIFLGRVGLYAQPASINRSLLLALVNFGELAAAFSVVYLHLDALCVGGAALKAWHEAFYFSVITATTIGYGDITPCSPAGRLVASVHAVASLVFLGMVFTLFVSRIKLEGPKQGPTSGEEP